MTRPFPLTHNGVRHSQAPVTIVGAGGHAGVVVDLISCLWLCSLDEIVDSQLAGRGVGRQIGGHQVNRRFDDLTDAELRRRTFVVAVGDATVRANLCATVLARGGHLSTLVHPRANVADSALLTGGVVVCALAHVGPAARVGVGTIVNTGAVVEHDCVVGDYAHVAARAALAGDVEIGTRSWVGLGASVLNGVRIGSDVTIGAGAVVIDDVPDGCTVVGVPARPIRTTPTGDRLRRVCDPAVAQ